MEQLKLYLNDAILLEEYLNDIKIDNNMLNIICKDNYIEVIEILLKKKYKHKWEIFFRISYYAAKYDNVEIVKLITTNEYNKSNKNLNYMIARAACENKAYNIMYYLMDLEFDKQLDIDKCIELAVNNYDLIMITNIISHKKYLPNYNLLLRNTIKADNIFLFKFFFEH